MPICIKSMDVMDARSPISLIECSFLQKFFLRNVPSLNDIGGPAEGCTCIITGPTRHGSKHLMCKTLLFPFFLTLSPTVGFACCSGIGRQTASTLVRRRAHGVFRHLASIPLFACKY